MHDHVAAMREHSAAEGLTASKGPLSLDQTPAFLGELLNLPAAADPEALRLHWAREFELLGGSPMIVRDHRQAASAVVEKVAEVLRRRGGHCAITAHPLLDEIGLPDALSTAGLMYETYRDKLDLPQLAKAEVGVVVASEAVAETGSFVLQSNAGQGRVSSLLPPVIIVIIPPGVITPGLAGWLSMRGERYRQGHEMPSSTVFATGPSRSADIAGDLALGVHGPGEVHAILLA